jgi:cytochrome c oxidase subunit III
MSHSNAAHHASHVQHHFVDSEQQFDSAKLGMWIFLVTEILFFGGLFVAYIVYRAWNPDLFTKASVELNTLLGAANTAVLIFSSLTMALAIREIQLDRVKRSIMYLSITIICAFFFMVVKYFEYTHKFEVGIFPGAGYTYTGIDDPQANIFFSIYYMMTGLHGIHVIIGIGLITWLIVKAQRGAFSSAYYTPIEITGLYWHLVDIIWIFLFPLFYLIE